MARVHPMFVIERCHVCGLVLRESQVQYLGADGRTTHRECTDPILIERQLHGLYMMAGLCARTFVKTVAGERFEVPTSQIMSVDLFKDGLMLRTGVPVARQRLLLHGVELTVGKLSDYGNIVDATVLMAEPRRALVVEALQTVIRHERESTVAHLRAELEQTRLERDSAYGMLHNFGREIQDELRRPDAPGNARQLLWDMRDGLESMFDGDRYQGAQQRG
jgi:hypothetical protein